MRNAIIAIVLAAAIAIIAWLNWPEKEASSDPVPFTPPEGSLIIENAQVPMRDGIRLNATAYIPGGGETPVPTILIRTPYSTELRGRNARLLERMMAKGYAVIQQHERGRYLSEGDFTMLPRPLADGWDTLDWIAAQGWSDGQVGTLGCSSSAENQLQLAAGGHPAHKAMVAMSAGVGVAQAGPYREQGNFWRGGVWQQGWMNYYSDYMHQDWPQLPAGLSDAARQRLLQDFAIEFNGFIDQEVYQEHRMHLPMIGIMDAIGAPRNEVPLYLERGVVHPSWDENRVSEGEVIAVPGYWAEAVYDISARSTIAYFEWNRAQNAAAGRNNQVMRITQGSHCGFGRETGEDMIGDMPLGDARFPYEDEIVAWFDRWMMGADEAPMPPAYRAYLSDGEWAEASAMPPGDAQVWALTAAGGFTSDAAEVEGYFTYTYDPADPVISVGGEIAGMGPDQDDGAFDQREVEARADVLTFTSEPLREDLPLLGFAPVTLTVSSDAPDTDFTVKLVDVYPDGTAYNIGDTILRMRYREGYEQAVSVTEGERYEIALPPLFLSRRIEAGHRLRVQVSSSNFPAYARSLNTALDPYTSTAVAVARNTLHVGGDAAVITLPVLPE